MFCGPRRLDAQQRAKVQERTLQSYRKAAAAFSEWLLLEGYSPSTADEWDDLLVEYKNERSVPKASFEHTVAAVEFFFPRHKGHLSWARSVLSGWGVQHVAKHTVPLSRGPAAYMSVYLASQGHPRMGFGLYLQNVPNIR